MKSQLRCYRCNTLQYWETTEANEARFYQTAEDVERVAVLSCTHTMPLLAAVDQLKMLNGTGRDTYRQDKL